MTDAALDRVTVDPGTVDPGTVDPGTVDPGAVAPGPGLRAVPAVTEVPAATSIAPDDVRIVTRYEKYGKRVLDVVGSLVLLLVLLPFILGTAVAVRLSMGPGVLYLQDRVGRGARTFRIYKFRSMRHDRRRTEVPPPDRPDRRLTHKTDADPRHTRVGRIIRKLSLDELPQLWNILKGDMSLVGPRPEIVAVARRAGIVDHPRHLVRPGLTGPWQLSAHRDEQISEHLEFDEEYVRRVTLRGDLRLLAATALAIVRGTGH